MTVLTVSAGFWMLAIACGARGESGQSRGDALNRTPDASAVVQSGALGEQAQTPVPPSDAGASSDVMETARPSEPVAAIPPEAPDASIIPMSCDPRLSRQTLSVHLTGTEYLGDPSTIEFEGNILGQTFAFVCPVRPNPLRLSEGANADTCYGDLTFDTKIWGVDVLPDRLVVGFLDFRFRESRLTIRQDGRVFLSEEFTPDYEVVQLNDPCNPEREATVTLTIPPPQ